MVGVQSGKRAAAKMLVVSALATMAVLSATGIANADETSPPGYPPNKPVVGGLGTSEKLAKQDMDNNCARMGYHNRSTQVGIPLYNQYLEKYAVQGYCN